MTGIEGFLMGLPIGFCAGVFYAVRVWHDGQKKAEFERGSAEIRAFDKAPQERIERGARRTSGRIV